jgi:hypothetical protein
MPPAPESMRKDSFRAWISGLAIITTTLIGLFGFWRLSPGLTFIIACVALAALVAALWIAGKR